MSLRYRLMYALGFRPWDNELVPDELRAVVEGADALSLGRALDLGCGTGTQAVYLASQGWKVTAIDAVPRALAKARQRAEREGVEVEWVQGDLTRLGDLAEPPFDLVHDRGCFHDLPGATRAGYAEGVTRLAAPGATFLLMAFGPRQGPGPSGMSEREVRDRFEPEWELLDVAPDTGPAPSGPMRNAERRWFTLRRR